MKQKKFEHQGLLSQNGYKPYLYSACDLIKHTLCVILTFPKQNLFTYAAVQIELKCASETFALLAPFLQLGA